MPQFASCSLAHAHVRSYSLFRIFVSQYWPLNAPTKTLTMNGFAPTYGQPPTVWQEHRTPEGRAYFYNSATKETTWTKPEEMMSPAEVNIWNIPGAQLHRC